MKMLLKAGIFWNHQRRLEVPRGWLGLSVVVTKSGTSWDKRHIYPAFETTPYFVNFFEEFAIIVIHCHCNTEEELRIFLCFLKTVCTSLPIQLGSFWRTRAPCHFEMEEVVVLLGGWREVLELELGVESLGPDWSSPDTAGVEGHSFSFHSFWVSKQFFSGTHIHPKPAPIS